MRINCFYKFLILASGLAALPGQAADYTLSQTVLGKYSAVGIDATGANAGVVSWDIDGVSQLGSQKFFYRVGAVGPESLVQSIDSTPVATFNALARTLDLTYDNGSYSVRTFFKLTSGSTPNLSETITVFNNSGASLDFHFFQYSDFNLFGQVGGQSVQFSQNSTTLQYYKAVQTDGARTVTELVNSANPPITHYEAGYFNSTLASLTDGGPTTLSDTASAGPGDVTFAYQWDVTLLAGESFQLSKLLTIVPEPSIFSLVALSAAGLRIMRRKRENS